MPTIDAAKWIDRSLSVAARMPYLGERAIYLGLRMRLSARVATLEKARNFLRAHADAKAKKLTVRSLPYVLNLDTMNVCNLACPFCATGTGQLERKAARFPLTEAKELIDRVKSHVLVARFHNWGEPFLNKDIFELIRYGHDAGIYTTTSSNLSVKVEGLAQKVVESRLDKMHVSIDGLEQATLEKYRRKASIDLVLGNIKEIVAEKRRRNCSTPRLDLVMLVFKHNEHEVPRLAAMAKELGVDSFTPARAFIYREDFVPDSREFRPSRSIWQETCNYLYSELMVEADGGISPCCTNTSAMYDIGHVRELGDLRDFWNRPILRAMRARSGGVPPDMDTAGLESLCDSCQFVGPDSAAEDVPMLSPLPPALAKAGEVFRADERDLARRV